MLFNLAATQLPVEDRDDAVRRRDRAASRLTAAQLAEAHCRASEWDEAHPLDEVLIPKLIP